MKIQFLVLWLSIFTSAARASDLAKGPELIYWYYAYQMDFYAYGAGSTYLAPKCNKAGDTTPCTLLKFIQTILFPSHKADFNKGISKLSPDDRALIDTVNPDILKVPGVLNTEFSDWTQVNKDGTISPKSWFLGVYEGKAFYKGYPKGIFEDFSRVYTDVTDAIQQIRKDVRDGKALVSSVDSYFQKAWAGFLLANGNRIADQSEGILTDITTNWIANVKTESKTLPDGRTYNAIDTKATITANGATPGSQAEKDFLTWYGRYTTEPGDQTGLSAEQKSSQRHQKILNTISTMASRLMGTPDC